MEPTQNNSARFSVGYFFLSLGVLITLVTSVTSFINLVFGTLDKRFPDVLNAVYQYGYSTYEYESIRMALATLIIFFPVFLIVSYFWNKFAKQGLGHIDEVVRKWVIYIILFLFAVIVIVDLVTLVRYFISGEITTRFVLKVLTILVVAKVVGFYYVSLIRSQIRAVFRAKLFLTVAILLVIGAITYSFMIIGSPMKQRALRMDDRRVNDLQSLQYQVINFWQQKEKLPADLKELANPLSGFSLPVDPEFEKGMSYEYIVKGPMTFELCATFAQPIPKGWREYSYGGGIAYPTMAPIYYEKDSVSYPYPGGGVNESWDHQAGRTCFSRTIDKDMYPPYPKPLR